MTKSKKGTEEKVPEGITKEGQPENQGIPEEAEGAERAGSAEDGAETAETGGGVDSPGSAESGQDGSEAGEGEAANVKYLRLAADFQNYKKRTERERFERYTDGKKDFAAAMLPIIDNFERALAQDAAEIEDEHDKMFVEGMDMIFKQFIDALAANGVTEIEALGEDFDPNVHHAVVMEPSDKYESQKVSEVLQKGFKLGEKIIRPSMVKVAE